MRILVEMDKTYGNYNINEYTIKVFRGHNEVGISFTNEKKSQIQKGGSFYVSTEVAERLGYTLLLASSLNQDSQQSISFSCNEDTLEK